MRGDPFYIPAMDNGLPNAGSEVIDPRKLRDYALNFEYATGRCNQTSYDGVDPSPW